MLYRDFGNTGFCVSRLCFGTLTIGPLQKGLTVKEGAYLLAAAYEHGVNFYDTAEYYGTYAYIKEAFPPQKEAVIAAKSYAYDKDGAKKSVERYLRESGRERIEVFLLHEQESLHTIRGHYEALEYYLKMKEDGLIGAVGISTHRISGVLGALKYPEIEVIHPLINFTGMGIADGTRQEMENAIGKAFAAGKALYGMKSLAGGNHIGKREEAFAYILGLQSLHAVAVGMHSEDEITYNAGYFSNEPVDTAAAERLSAQKRSIIIDEYCIACGSCIKRCSQHALSMREGEIHVDREKCILCSYCGKTCESFAIKII